MHARTSTYRLRKGRGNLLVAGLFGLAASSLTGVAFADSTPVASHGETASGRNSARQPHLTLNAPEAGGRNAGGDAVKTYTGAGGDGKFSTGTNWSPTGAPVAGDTITFGATPAGNYTVINDLSSTVFGPLTENRAAATQLVTLQGGYNGYTIQATRGAFTLDGGTTTVPGNFGLTQASIDASLRIGIGAGFAATFTAQNAAVVNYHTFLHGSTGGTGTVNITGAGTVLNPISDTSGDAVSTFRGGGAGTSTVNIVNGATVTTNVSLSNLIDTTTIASGGTLTCLDYIDAEIQYGGEIEVGYFTNTSTTAPNAVLNLNSGGTINSTFLQVASGGPGEQGTLNVNGGVANVIILGAGRPTANGTAATPSTYANGFINVTNGGVINTGDFVAGEANTAFVTANVTGAGSKIVGDGVLFLGGNATTDPGAGSATLNITAGGTVSTSQAQFGGANGTVKAPTYTGVNVNVSGVGSRLDVTGSLATDVDPTFSALLFIGNGIASTAALNITNGGVVNLTQDSADTDQNGALILGQGQGTTTTVTVDGTGSILHAGVFMQVTQSGTTVYTNSSTTINVRNGGLLDVIDDGVVDSGDGNIQLGTTPAAGASITVNLGVANGTNTSDANSAILADGGIFVGGGGTADAPTTGVATTINVNNGELGGGAIVVAAGSVVNLNKGLVDGGLLSARGGTFKIASTAAAGVGLLEAGVFEAVAGGQFDIGKSGGVSFIVAGDTTDDLTRVRSLIVAGYNGGTWDGLNSIRSSVIAADSRLAIGYANTTTSNITSFLGETFGGATDTPAIVFRTTLKGDTNVDATVNFPDLLSLAQAYAPGVTGKQWYQGDSNYDGIVDFADLLALAQNYGATYTLTSGLTMDSELHGQFAADWALAQSLVPEPTTLGVLAGMGAMALRRRRSVR